LVSPEYFGYNAIWYIPPEQRVDTNTMTSAVFRRDAVKNEFVGVLAYRIQRKKSRKFSANNTSTKDKSTYQFLVILKSDSWCGFCAHVLLIKHDDMITWDGDELKKLYSMRRPLDIYCHTAIDKWRLDDATVLMTKIERELGHTIEITIFGGHSKYDSAKPIWVSSNI
jgi:hypothetical protein